MNIQKLDLSSDLGEVTAMLAGKEDIQTLFQKSIEKDNEGTYITRYDDEIAGFLSLNRFNSKRVDVILYVDEKNRRKGIGNGLLRVSDEIISNSPFEHAYCSFTADEGTAKFLSKNSYQSYCSAFDMERDNTLIDSGKLSDAALLERGIVIRNYKDDDYIAYHNVSDVAFFLLREKLGLKPSYYLPPLEMERERLAKAAANRYVMVVDDIITAIGAISNHWIHLLAVRPDLQQRGYGRMMASYLNNKIITEQNAGKVKISVLDGNLAKRLYEQLGFREVRLSYDYVKYYKPDSRQRAPKGYANEEEILNELKAHGMLREEMVP